MYELFTCSLLDILFNKFVESTHALFSFIMSLRHSNVDVCHVNCNNLQLSMAWMDFNTN